MISLPMAKFAVDIIIRNYLINPGNMLKRNLSVEPVIDIDDGVGRINTSDLTVQNKEI